MHSIEREEWYWNAQDYNVLYIHFEDCIGCRMGIPVE